MSYHVYIVECSDGTYYCGYSSNLDARMRAHNDPRNGARYTKFRRPVKLIYSEEFQSKSEAMKREYAIKKLSRKRKKLLVWSIKN